MLTNTYRNQIRLRGWSDLERRYRLPIIIFVLSLIGALGWSAFYHYTLFIQADSARAAALTKAQMQEKTIHELLHRQQVLSGQEQQQARELADARATIRRLQTEYDNSHSMAEHSAL